MAKSFLATSPILALLLTASCSLFATQAKLDRLDLEFSNLEVTFPYEVRVRVGVRGPDGTERSAEGLGMRGAMVRALCFSLCRQLEGIGCEATYRDMDGPVENEAPEQALRRAQRQTVALPDGWTFVFARTSASFGTTHDGRSEKVPDNVLTFTMRPGN